ncbi:uncharacterized protein LOC106094813 [Stomoxys calcitrans]|uniref:Uncharacterized protein n=1 Tax=Stomoxys calcitrans TaxID=35570 RepID=A0A1I8Q8R1_STOCA|nr:uncharacterized protein LOC106094813 [Stomoxys calcitrans]
MLLHWIFLLLSTWDLFLQTQAKRRFYLELYNASCNEFTLPVLTFECNLIKVARSQYAISASAIFDRELPRSVELGIILYTKHKSGEKSRRLTNLKINFCDLISHVNLIPMIKEYVVYFYRTSNWPIACPILGNHMYNITNLTVSEEDIPAYRQFSQFNFSLTLTNKGKQFSTFKLIGALVPRT